jgi:FLVCR family feline leukemia virus subgroup C receptor-related protein
MYRSEIEKLVKGEQEPPFIDSIRKLFSNPGFFKPMASFIMSLSITNIVGVSTLSIDSLY